jgi:ribose-phosphate pyrophosphokinase
MAPRIVPGPASNRLAAMISHHLRTEPVACTVHRFPDGELRPELGSVRGDDVYVVQSTGPPANDRLVELLLLLDACRRAGADRITAVVPYFGYARQDCRSRPGQAIGARTAADALTACGAQRLLVVDPHTPALEALFAIPTEMLTALPVLTPALADLPADTVVVAPDLGAVKLAEHVAARLDRPVAVVRKTRITGSTVHAEQLIGTVADRPILIVDDMISTGATIEAAAQIALAHHAVPQVAVAATHGLVVGDAAERLHALPLRRLVVTDTTTLPAGPPSWVDLRSVDVLLGDAIDRLHRDQPLDELLLHT